MKLWSHIQARLLDRTLLPGTSRGQATVEYLIVGVALIVIIAALGVLSGRLHEGLFVQHAADSASHAITTNTAGSAGDILLY